MQEIPEYQHLQCLIYFRKHKIIFSSSIISLHWNSICKWNPSLQKMFNTMVTDDLVMQGARASVAMVLIIDPVILKLSGFSITEGLKQLVIVATWW